MRHIGISEAKTRLSEGAPRIAAGEEYMITNKGAPIMKLTRVDTADRESSVQMQVRSPSEIPSTIQSTGSAV